MLTRTRRQDFSALRQRAEISAAEDQDPTVLSPAEVQRLLHELQVHQIELEMQNEELRQTQAELEWSRQCYFDLYNQAPVGYITVTSSGYIHEANLKAAALLGMQPGELVGRPLGRFFLPSDYDDFYRRHRQLLRTGEPQACDGRLAPRAPGAAITWVRLDLALAQTGP
ncbi:MAG: PAS domain-containing protein, partial [Nitrososphaerales archaeon]